MTGLVPQQNQTQQSNRGSGSINNPILKKYDPKRKTHNQQSLNDFSIIIRTATVKRLNFEGPSGSETQLEYELLIAVTGVIHQCAADVRKFSNTGKMTERLKFSSIRMYSGLPSMRRSCLGNFCVTCATTVSSCRPYVLPPLLT